MKIKQIQLLLLTAFFLIQGCHSSENNSTDSSKPDKVKAVISPFLGFAPYFIAVEEGFFEQQNIELEFVELTQNVQALPQLIQGNIDVSAGFLYPALINAIIEGEKPKIVADKGYLAANGCTYLGLLQNPDAPVTDFVGARVAMRSNTIYGYYLEQFLKTKGLKLEDIEEVAIPVPARGTALANQSVDLLSVGEPWMRRTIVENNAELIHSAQDVIPDMACAFMYFSPHFMSGRPDVAQRFMVAYLQGVRQYNKGKTERNLDIIAQYTKLDKELLKEVCWVSIDNKGDINTTSVMDYQDWLLKYQLIKEPIEIDRLWDNQFIDAAVEILDKK